MCYILQKIEYNEFNTPGLNPKIKVILKETQCIVLKIE
jgi:hypothetical protein